MTKNGSLLVCLIFVSFATYAQAQQTIVSPTRSVDWRNVGISGGIPNRTTICSTLSPGATAAQISSAIAACPSGQVVKLNAGTYSIGGIDFGGGKSNVTLRGAGADQTLIVFNSGAAVACNGLFANVCMHSSDTNYQGSPSNVANWTAGYAKGTSVITLSSVTNLTVGKAMILDQLDDTTDSGGIYVCEVGGSIGQAQRCNDDGPNGGPGGGARPNRAQIQIVTVTAISGTQVTISPALYMPNWRSSQTPGAWWATNPAIADGIESLSLDHSGSDEGTGIGLFNCQGCWVKGIRSINSNRSHVWNYSASPRTIVRDNYFYGTKNSVSQSYGVEAFPAADMLVENNIFQRITAPQIINAGCSGCVVAYNYSINDYYTQSPTYLMQGAWLHAGGIDNILFEGNVGAGLYGDDFHGTHHFATVFRNRFNGWETTKAGHLLPFDLHPFSRFFNLIGNVLGQSGIQSGYQSSPGQNANAPIFQIGTGAVDVLDDTATLTTLMRWGNWDTVNATARFVAAEVPSALTGAQAPYSNPVPASQTLPASFYLSSKPGWWPSSKPWPAIGPDVTGGNIANVGGHAYTNPAQDCYTTIGGPADGSGNPLTFNAASCYTSTGIAAPTNLRIIR